VAGQMRYGADNSSGVGPGVETILRSQNTAGPTLVVKNEAGALPNAIFAGPGLEVIGGPFGVKGTGGVDIDEVTPYVGVHGIAAGDYGVGVKGEGERGVEGISTRGSNGVTGTTTGLGNGVAGTTTGFGNGVKGTNTSNGNGVEGISEVSNGVRGQSKAHGCGVLGVNWTLFGGFGVRGESSALPGSGGAGVVGRNPNGGLAGLFAGQVRVSGYIWKDGGGFQIDNPLDPANRYLYHSFVESPDMMNVYNGNVSTDADGNATVELPGYFEALNRDFRYQLTAIGEFAQAIVAEEVTDNRFRIKTDRPNVRVSWQITGIRQDAWANAHRIEVDVEKSEGERGKYLAPTEHGQPATAGIYHMEEFPSSEETEADRDQQQGE
jgi:hypothetical protein